MDKKKDMRTIISHPKAAGRPSDKNLSIYYED